MHGQPCELKLDVDIAVDPHPPRLVKKSKYAAGPLIALAETACTAESLNVNQSTAPGASLTLQCAV